MRRKTEITMLPSRGKPNLELAAKLMVPLIIDSLLKNKNEPAPTSSNKKPDIDVHESSNF